MKITTYHCDGPNCSSRVDDDLTGQKWLSIEPEGGKLRIKNNCENRKLIAIDRHSGIHFCSEMCFINKFFYTEEKFRVKS
jgi:hypothetical protein